MNDSGEPTARRPLGYAIVAVVLLVMSLGGFASVFWAPLELLGGDASVWDRLIPLLLTGAGLHAAWMIWRYERRAPEAYLLWAALLVGNTAYAAFVLLPRLIDAMARRTGMPAPIDFPRGLRIYQTLFVACILGLGYWYLASHRKRLPGEVPTEPRPPR